MLLKLFLLPLLLFSGLAGSQSIMMLNYPADQKINIIKEHLAIKLLTEIIQPDKGSQKFAARQGKPKPSSITKKVNVDGATLSRRGGDGNRVEVMVVRSGVPFRNLEDFTIMSNSGTPVTSGNYLGIDNANFPLQGSIRFAAMNKLNTVKYSREVSFEITEPGYWVLRITI